jgi:hypothetical protein
VSHRSHLRYRRPHNGTPCPTPAVAHSPSAALLCKAKRNRKPRIRVLFTGHRRATVITVITVPVPFHPPAAPASPALAGVPLEYPKCPSIRQLLRPRCDGRSGCRWLSESMRRHCQVAPQCCPCTALGRQLFRVRHWAANYSVCGTGPPTIPCTALGRQLFRANFGTARSASILQVVCLIAVVVHGCVGTGALHLGVQRRSRRCLVARSPARPPLLSTAYDKPEPH